MRREKKNKKCGGSRSFYLVGRRREKYSFLLGCGLGDDERSKKPILVK
jgi:hypothetical protein